MPVIHFETFNHALRQRVFDVNLDVDAHAAAFAATGERAVGGVTHGLLSLGDTVTWEAVHFGVRQRLATRITHYDRPHAFRDEMTAGAFHSFQHDHTFTEADGGTLMVDHFAYTAPLGMLGVLADRLFLRRYVQRLLMQRAGFIKMLAERASQPA